MSDEIDDRLSKRFGGEKDTDDQQDDTTDMSTHSQNDSTAQSSQKAQNIKKEWNVRSIYLDDDLDNELTTAFKRLDLDLSEADADVDLKKTRHFYPLVVALGLERLESMEVTEVTEQLEGKENQ